MKRLSWGQKMPLWLNPGGGGGVGAAGAAKTCCSGAPPGALVWLRRQTGPWRSKSLLAASQLRLAPAFPGSCFRQTGPDHTSTHTRTILTTDRLTPDAHLTGQWRCGPNILKDPFSDDSDRPRHGPTPSPFKPHYLQRVHASSWVMAALDFRLELTLSAV